MNEPGTWRAAARCLCAGIACASMMVAILARSPARADDAAAPGLIPLRAMDGRQIYEHICQGCHMPGAAGAVGAGHYPALAKDPILTSRRYTALTILTGRRNMPAFGAKHAVGFVGPPITLSNEQIAAVVNYVRTNFGNHYRDPITAAEVAALDESAP